MNIDFEIKEQQLPVIQINFEQLKDNLLQTMSTYKGLIVTEDTLKDCKATQKELAGIRNKIDRYRKDVKTEMSKPIKEFEDKCKELIGLVQDAEQPIKEGIQFYDDARREEKRQSALNIIKEVIESQGLSEKYASELTVADKYMNLTANERDVREDVEQRAFLLKEKQHQEEENLKIIQSIIDKENQSIKTKISLSDFTHLISMGMSTTQVIEEIQKRAERIRIAEKPKEPDPTPEPIQEPVQESNQEPQNKEIKKFYVDIKVTGSKEQIEALGAYLRANKYSYEVKDKGVI
jgi:two-component sensor histidine kinase